MDGILNGAQADLASLRPTAEAQPLYDPDRLWAFMQVVHMYLVITVCDKLPNNYVAVCKKCYVEKQQGEMQSQYYTYIGPSTVKDQACTSTAGIHRKGFHQSQWAASGRLRLTSPAAWCLLSGVWMFDVAFSAWRSSCLLAGVHPLLHQDSRF